jgi:GTP-binding protein EngB required for normal cell division
LTNKNKEKSRLLAQYIRNARVIEEAFEVIREGSGIKNLDEIVTTFIKSEE